MSYRRIVQIMPAVPGEFVCYYFDENSNDETFSAPVIAWALCDVIRDGVENELEHDREVRPLTHDGDRLDVEPEDSTNSLGLYRVAEVTEEGLRLRIEKVKLDNEERRRGAAAERAAKAARRL